MPFVNKISETEKQMLANQKIFLDQREEALNKVKGYSGLIKLERSYNETM